MYSSSRSPTRHHQASSLEPVGLHSHGYRSSWNIIPSMTSSTYNQQHLVNDSHENNNNNDADETDSSCEVEFLFGRPGHGSLFAVYRKDEQDESTTSKNQFHQNNNNNHNNNNNEFDLIPVIIRVTSSGVTVSSPSSAFSLFSGSYLVDSLFCDADSSLKIITGFPTSFTIEKVTGGNHKNNTNSNKTISLTATPDTTSQKAIWNFKQTFDRLRHAAIHNLPLSEEPQDYLHEDPFAHFFGPSENNNNNNNSSRSPGKVGFVHESASPSGATYRVSTVGGGDEDNSHSIPWSNIVNATTTGDGAKAMKKNNINRSQFTNATTATASQHSSNKIVNLDTTTSREEFLGPSKAKYDHQKSKRNLNLAFAAFDDVIQRSGNSAGGAGGGTTGNNDKDDQNSSLIFAGSVNNDPSIFQQQQQQHQFHHQFHQFHQSSSDIIAAAMARRQAQQYAKNPHLASPMNSPTDFQSLSAVPLPSSSLKPTFNNNNNKGGRGSNNSNNKNQNTIAPPPRQFVAGPGNVLSQLVDGDGLVPQYSNLLSPSDLAMAQQQQQQQAMFMMMQQQQQQFHNASSSSSVSFGSAAASPPPPMIGSPYSSAMMMMMMNDTSTSTPLGLHPNTSTLRRTSSAGALFDQNRKMDILEQELSKNDKVMSSMRGDIDKLKEQLAHFATTGGLNSSNNANFPRGAEARSIADRAIKKKNDGTISIDFDAILTAPVNRHNNTNSSSNPNQQQQQVDSSFLASSGRGRRGSFRAESIIATPPSNSQQHVTFADLEGEQQQQQQQQHPQEQQTKTEETDKNNSNNNNNNKPKLTEVQQPVPPPKLPQKTVSSPPTSSTSQPPLSLAEAAAQAAIARTKAREAEEAKKKAAAATTTTVVTSPVKSVEEKKTIFSQPPVSLAEAAAQAAAARAKAREAEEEKKKAATAATAAVEKKVENTSPPQTAPIVVVTPPQQQQQQQKQVEQVVVVQTQQQQSATTTTQSSVPPPVVVVSGGPPKPAVITNPNAPPPQTKPPPPPLTNGPVPKTW